MPIGSDPPQSKLNAGVHTAIVDTARRGNYMTTCAAMIGVSPRTIMRWLQRGEQDLENGEDTSYARLYRDVSQASAQFEDEMVNLVADAARANPQNWAAAMTILERKHPDRFGRRDTTVLEGGDRPAIVVNIGDEDTRRLSRELLRRLSQPGPVAELTAGDVIEATKVTEGTVDDDV